MKENKSNGLDPIIAQAIEEMKSEQGNNFALERINLAELERRTGISRAKLRRLKANNFNQKAHGLMGQKQQTNVLSGYAPYLDKLLRQGITNSAVCRDRLREFGFEGSLSTVKRYIKAHKHLVPAKRQLVTPQAVGSLLNREKPTRWIGASPRCWTMTVRNTPRPALQWSVTIAGSGMWSSFPMPSRRISSLA